MKYIVSILILTVIIQLKLYSQWEMVTTVPYPYNQNYWLEIWFLNDDPNYGWICGYDSEVIRTTDGGNTWAGSIVDQNRRNFQLESICFVDKNTGYTSGMDNDTDLGIIYKTTDGGITWNEITPYRNVALWGNWFLNQNYGIVIGGGCDGSPIGIYRTTDGGRNWSNFTVSAPTSGLTDLILYPNGNGFATSSGLIWTTNDSGKSWTFFSTSGPSDWQEDLWVNKSTILVPYADGCTGDGSGGGGIRTSQDSGKHWLDFSTGQKMFGGFLLDDKKGWGCGLNGALYYTNNGGVTWRSRACGINGDNLDDLWFFNDTSGFVCGQNLYRFKNIDTLNPKIVPGPNLQICRGDSIVISVDSNFNNYQWNTGESTKSITIASEGTYQVNVWNDTCDFTSSNLVTLSFYPDPIPRIIAIPDSESCAGDTITLICQEDYPQYLWSSGETTKEIKVTNSGIYSIFIRDSLSCRGNDSINIIFHPLPTPKIQLLGNPDFCIGDSVQMFINGNYNPITWYKVGSSIPYMTQSLYTSYNTGNYYAVVVDSFGCVGISDTISTIMRMDTNRLSITLLPGQTEIDLDSAQYPSVNCKTLKISNISEYPVEIDDAYLVKNISFSIPQSQFPINISPFDSILLKICYSPGELNIERDTLILSDTCRPHYVPLRAVGVTIDYSGNTNCNINVLMNSISIPGKINYLILDAAYPNPTDSYTDIPFAYFDGNGNRPDIRPIIYNYLGEKCGYGSSEITQDNSNGNLIAIGGLIRIETEKLSSGIYIIIINEGTETFKQSIIVQH